MTSMTQPSMTRTATPTTTPLGPKGLGDLLRSEPWTAHGVLSLTLRDGVERPYLLDPRDFAATTAPEVAYDARVHAAYILALQGHRPTWLAQHLDLPRPATDAICDRAEAHGPDGPRNGPTQA